MQRPEFLTGGKAERHIRECSTLTKVEIIKIDYMHVSNVVEKEKCCSYRLRGIEQFCVESSMNTNEKLAL